jgi:AcrR family transcriptional regulator
LVGDDQTVTKVPKKRSYHHGSLSRALIEAALDLVRERGPHGVTMREAARRAGVSSGAPYRHFADLTALMRAVAAEGERCLAEAMAAAAARAGSDPGAQFRAQGIAYVLFAVREPSYFRVMNIPEFADGPGTEWAIQTIVDAQAQGELASGEAHTILLASVALVHGLAHLFIDGQMMRFGIGTDRAEDIAEAVTAVLARGLRPRPG